jgi:hypothetical protein
MKRVVAAGIVIVMAVFAIWYFTRSDEQASAFRSREDATRMLAEYLAKKFPQGGVVVASNPFTTLGASPDTVKMEQAGIAGLRKGFGKSRGLRIVLPELKPGARTDPRSLLRDPETPTPLSYLVAEESFDKLVADADVVVSLIGLPAELNRLSCWQKTGKPTFGLLFPDLRLIGNAVVVQSAMKNGKLAAFVVANPDRRKGQSPFLLVTPEGLSNVTQRYPALLPTD